MAKLEYRQLMKELCNKSEELQERPNTSLKKNDPETCDHYWVIDTEFSTREMHSSNSGLKMIFESNIYYCKKCDTYKEVNKEYQVPKDTEL